MAFLHIRKRKGFRQGEVGSNKNRHTIFAGSVKGIRIFTSEGKAKETWRGGISCLSLPPVTGQKIDVGAAFVAAP